jgi:tetratricopeptide (TPR) repeat protein
MRERLAPWALVLVAACGSAGASPPAATAASAPLPSLALLPSAPGADANAPSFLTAAASLTGARVADVDACEGCHVDVATQWRASAHSFASFNNPVYRTVVEKFRAEVGFRPSRFCGGCHDVALVVDRAMDAPIATADARAQAGINCRVCHGVTSATVDGNGSVAIGAAEIPVPSPDDPASVRRHVAALHRPVRDDAAFCGGCHRAFLDEDVGNASFLIGQDDFTPWSRSVYAGSVLERIDDEPVRPATCQGCHMPLEPAVLHDPAAKHGQIHSHRFLGGHTWMSAMRGDADQLGRAAAQLRGALSVDVFPAASSTPARPVVDVVVRNLRVGHRFPGGVMDAQDAWLEVVVHDADGRLLASSTDADGAAAHRLRSLMVDEHGVGQDVRETHRFRVAAWNHTIAPRDAAVIAYAFDAPAGARPPFRVDAALRHRSRDAALQAAACADARSERGRAFAASSRELLGTFLDPCTPQPVTEIARASVAIGAGGASVWTWRQHFAHALGLGHAVSERLDEARVAYQAALAALPADPGAGPHERAAVLAGLGQIAGKQGRLDDAIALFDQAQALWPDHPALGYLRGEAYAGVWRWAQAAPLLAAAAARAPRDDLAWARAATAYQSLGQPILALAAAQRGLAGQPRSADLLRIQALALQLLTAPGAIAQAALEAWVARHPADDSPRYRSMCQKRDPGCVRERNPVHVHELSAPAAARTSAVDTPNSPR